MGLNKGQTEVILAHADRAVIIVTENDTLRAMGVFADGEMIQVHTFCGEGCCNECEPFDDFWDLWGKEIQQYGQLVPKKGPKQ